MRAENSYNGCQGFSELMILQRAAKTWLVGQRWRFDLNSENQIFSKLVSSKTAGNCQSCSADTWVLSERRPGRLTHQFKERPWKGEPRDECSLHGETRRYKLLELKRVWTAEMLAESSWCRLAGSWYNTYQHLAELKKGEGGGGKVVVLSCNFASICMACNTWKGVSDNC